MKKTSDLRKLLETRYSGSSWALFFEVANATGFAKNRSADAVAMSLWPSRGLELIGHEIKVSRADWLKEKKQPEKAHAVGRFCHRWWVVAADRTIVTREELPQGWGLLVPKGTGLGVVVEAPLREVEPPTYEFFASLCRSASVSADERVKVASAPGLATATEAYQRGLKDGEAKNVGVWAQTELEQLRAMVAEFEKETGIPLSSARWRMKDVVATSKVALAAETNLARLRRLTEGCGAAHASLQQALEEIQALLPPKS